MVRNPHEAIVHNVILYRADGSEPRITQTIFNEEGARANPYAIYTINVDLRGNYGKCNMLATRSRRLKSQADKSTEGEYTLFHNISPKLPINALMARLVSVNPKKPGGRPLWRGDLVVVKMQEWPGPRVPRGGVHMDYVEPALSIFSYLFITHWYKSDDWANLLQDEKDFSTW
ncbi:hypothetical protein B0H19DRAFT_1267438 [Mycena capillaripes]|nr:hypothetical protein B0H19DRAFT_1267438 [Mycena capillaripes]